MSQGIWGLINGGVQGIISEDSTCFGLCDCVDDDDVGHRSRVRTPHRLGVHTVCGGCGASGPMCPKWIWESLQFTVVILLSKEGLGKVIEYVV